MKTTLLLIGIALVALYKWDLDEIVIFFAEIRLKLIELWIIILGGKK